MVFATHNQLRRDEKLHFIIPPNVPPAVLTATHNALAPATLPPPPPNPSPVKWSNPPSAIAVSSDAPILSIGLPQSSGLPKGIVWHRKGDYFATVCTWPFHSRSPYPRPDSVRSPILSERGRTGWRMDPPGVKTTFAGAVQEGQGRGAARPLPSDEAAILRGCTYHYIS